MGARLAIALGIAACALPAQASAEVLSNERTRTTWAHPRYPAEVAGRAQEGARRVARLRRHTEDGFKDVYVVLRDSADGRWLKVRIPGRPNGRRGWVRRGGLGKLRVVTTRLVLDRRRLRITLFRSGKRFWSAAWASAPPRPPPRAGVLDPRALPREGCPDLRPLRGGAPAPTRR